MQFQAFFGIRRSDCSNIRASEGSATVTLTVNDNPWQVFNISASKICVLPTTSVKSGDKVVIENSTFFDLTIQASNTSALTVANGTNLEAAIQKGVVVLEALQDTPTTPAHWRVVYLHDNGLTTVSVVNGVSGARNCQINYKRTNNVITLLLSMSTATGSTGIMSTAAAALPTKLYQSTRTFMIPIISLNNSLTYVAEFRVTNTGALECRTISGTWSGTCSFQGGADYSCITYSFDF